MSWFCSPAFHQINPDHTSVTSFTIRQLFQGNTAAVWRTWRTQQTRNNPERWCHWALNSRWYDSSCSWALQDADAGSRTARGYKGMGRVGVSENGGHIMRMRPALDCNIEFQREQGKTIKIMSFLQLKHCQLTLFLWNTTKKELFPVMMRRIILHRCRHWTFLKPTLNILQKTKVETSPCNSLLSSFRVFTTPNHSDYSRKDPMNPTFSSLGLLLEMQTSTESFLPQEGTHCYVLYIRPSCDPVFSAQPTPSFCSISESSYSIQNWYTESAQQQNIHKPPSNQHSWTAQPMLGHPTFHSFFTHLTTRH